MRKYAEIQEWNAESNNFEFTIYATYRRYLIEQESNASYQE